MQRRGRRWIVVGFHILFGVLVLSSLILARPEAPEISSRTGSVLPDVSVPTQVVESPCFSGCYTASEYLATAASLLAIGLGFYWLIRLLVWILKHFQEQA